MSVSPDHPASPQSQPPPAPLILVLMGVSGAGKTTIAEALNAHLHWPFQEGDDLHPPENVAKMHAGTPLDDADREPWLRAVAGWIDARRRSGQPGMITCSALKRRYRDIIRAGHEDVRFIYLHADRAVLADRLDKRRGHYMPASLLTSQLETLQEPAPDEHPLIIEVHKAVEDTVAEILNHLGIRA